MKYATNNLEGVSITNDFTLEERKQIKEMVDEAKRRNDNESNDGTSKDYAWKLRGNPRIGMRLVNVAIHQQQYTLFS